jgi:hypothetical protein
MRSRSRTFGGLGVNKSAETVSPHSSVKLTFNVHAQLTSPNPPNRFGKNHLKGELAMSVPPSLKRTEQEIAQELFQSNIKINFQILNYCKENLDVQYRLFSNQMPLQGTEKQARAIVDKHVNNWKATCAQLTPVLCT